MLWTTVSDLPFTHYSANLVTDLTNFKNNAQIFGSISKNPNYVTFKNPDNQLVIIVKDDSLQRFTGLRVDAMIYPTSLPHRLNIVEGWMSFAFFIESNGYLMATIYDGHSWIPVVSGTTKVPLNQWSNVSFEYDGISIGILEMNGATVGTNINMPMGMRQPNQNITIGHWPSGDGRYTFVGNIGHTIIKRRDYEDFWRGAALMLFCNRKLSPAQADAMMEFDAIIRTLDPKIKEAIRKCAQERSTKLLELFRTLRDGNMRNIVVHRQLGNSLREAWCCKVDESKIRQILLDFLSKQSGPEGSLQRKKFFELVGDFLKLKNLCQKKGVPFDRMEKLLLTAVPELAFVEIEFEQIVKTLS